MNAVLQKFPKDVKLVFKQYPLSNHSQAALAAEASLAAHAQGKFWEMHDIMYAHFRDLSREHIFGWAKQIGLNMDRFKADLDSRKFKAQVEKETAEGDAAGVEGTPTFYVNGQKYNGSLDPEAFAAVLTGELKKTKK
ncbi:MAG: thioredoxin domain-containing protein [Candidatus Solibacter usitatus]|nr:thioredoxin domain-containing protein [Candidatus Solibacter usitatus]